MNNPLQEKIYLEPNIRVLTSYLRNKGWLAPDDSIGSLQTPGPGNMNFVLRVLPSTGNAYIIKQARPWVEKYPHLKAPVERIFVEYQYYKHINQQLTLARYSPNILGFDEINAVLAMEDLGDTVDFSDVYRRGQNFEQRYLQASIEYLNRLKKTPVPSDYPANLDLRKLNHEHIFILPFEKNSFELDHIQEGLSSLAEVCQQDLQLVSRIKELGQIYLESGKYLLHGDFYPGSLLKSKGGELKVIDPEFSFVGPEEWDVAVFTAHLFLSQTPVDLIRATLKSYQLSGAFNYRRFLGFTATEILRRLLGLAQVPVELTLEEKTRLVRGATSWIKTGKFHTLSGNENDPLIG